MARYRKDDQDFNWTSPLPWRSGNRFELLIDGQHFFERMLSAIEQARTSIELEMYLFESGKTANYFIEALTAAVSRQVTVRVLLDHAGSMQLKPQDRKRLVDAGVELRFYNQLIARKTFRNLARDHRKLLIVDDAIAFTGGAGITDEFNPEVSGNLSWRETMIAIEGRHLLQDWKKLFERTWHHYKGPTHLRSWKERYYSYTHRSAKRYPRLSNVKSQARVNASRGMGSEQIKAALIAEIRKARYTAWIATAYFYPSRKLRRELIKAAKRGVDVRLLLPGPRTDHPSVRYAGQSYYAHLIEHGVKIYEYQPRFLHMKVAVVDDWISIGSCNFDRWNLKWNLEANQEIIDPQLANLTRDMFVNDFHASRLIDPNYWTKRPWLARLKQRFWHRIGLAIDRWMNQ